MRTYFNLPPGVSPRDIEEHANRGEDLQLTRAHAEGWLTRQVGLDYDNNPYTKTDNEKWIDTPHSMWSSGFLECGDENVFENNPTHRVKLIDECLHAYAGQVVRVVCDDETGVYVWPGRPHSVRFCPESYIENEWRRKPSARELEAKVEKLEKELAFQSEYIEEAIMTWDILKVQKENAELTGKLHQALHTLDVIAAHYGINPEEFVEQVYNGGVENA